MAAVCYLSSYLSIVKRVDLKHTFLTDNKELNANENTTTLDL